MALFVHLTPAKNIRSIRKHGLLLKKNRWFRAAGIFAMPVVPDFVVTHQWVRELRRWGRQEELIAVHFRIPDTEPVLVGHYNEGMKEMTAAEASHLIASTTKPFGYQVLIQRAIRPKELHAIRTVRQVVGWRYRPGSNGTRPCVCMGCNRGQWGIQRLKRAAEKTEKRKQTAKTIVFGR
ncbi:MAG TPA: hypothetical protein PLL06_14025 [Acidobacteriota bacterium]|nr:hypothetical protein [Acidobacteriota bacterium]HNJ44004.1 hypothetical protein [Acidobacteriota bacterium]